MKQEMETGFQQDDTLLTLHNRALSFQFVSQTQSNISDKYQLMSG